MEKIAWKGTTLLGPVPPVLVTCGTMSEPNALTIAWTGIINSHPPKTYISVRKERYSHEIISQTKEFVINLPSAPIIRAIDYCGVRSGRDENKLEATNLGTQKVKGYKCPMIEQSPVSLACKVTEIIELGTHDMFLADITDVYVAEEYMDEKGKLNLAKAKLCAYVHGEYFQLGKRVGTFGFSVKKRKRKPTNKKGKK